MLLAIDVGNTTIVSGFFGGSAPRSIIKIPTLKPASQVRYSANLKKILRGKRIDDVIISSVVPQTTNALNTVFKESFDLKPIIIGRDLVVPIKNLYKDPKQVGQDRLVNAFAGYKKFGPGLIIVDFGTAVTFDVVSKKGEYAGGIIAPGLETGLAALFEKTALLPKVDLEIPVELIGRDTRTSMLSGILHGLAALCDGLTAKIKKEDRCNYKVILTGGNAKLMSRYCRYDMIAPNLTLEGLALLYRNIR